RRLAGIALAPFIKVEASRFTEVGYVGRDVESMVRDLVEISVNMVRQEKTKMVEEKAKQFAEERILDILLPVPPTVKMTDLDIQDSVKSVDSTREKMRALLRDGKLDDRIIELDVTRQKMPFIEIFSQAGIEDLSGALEQAFGSRLPKKKKKIKMPVKEALRYIQNEEAIRKIRCDGFPSIAEKSTPSVERANAKTRSLTALVRA
ncbi:unnamed protein product, partial [marine sediment metagenome]